MARGRRSGTGHRASTGPPSEFRRYTAERRRGLDIGRGATGHRRGPPGLSRGRPRHRRRALDRSVALQVPRRGRPPWPDGRGPRGRLRPGDRRRDIAAGNLAGVVSASHLRGQTALPSQMVERGAESDGTGTSVMLGGGRTAVPRASGSLALGRSGPSLCGPRTSSRWLSPPCGVCSTLVASSASASSKGYRAALAAISWSGNQKTVVSNVSAMSCVSTFRDWVA